MAGKTSNNRIKTTVQLDVNQVQQQIVKLNSSASDTTKKLEDRIKDKNKAVELQNKLSKKTIADAKKEQQSLIKSGGSLKEVTKATKKLNTEKLKATKISAANTKQQNKLNASTKSSGKGFGFLSKGLAGAKAGVLGMIPALGGLTTAIAATGIGALVIAIAAIGIGMLGAIKTGAKFGKALSGLKAVSGSTKSEMVALSDQAKSLGASTAFTAREVVGLQTELAKLGFVAGDIQNSTPAILDLAAALDVDLASAAEFAGSTVRSFGLDSSETQRVVDVMAKSASSSAQSFGTLVESFKLVAPTSRALGISVEETSAYLGALANNGLKGSIAGTGLSKSFIMLHKRGLTLNEGLEKVRNSSDGLSTAIELVGIIGAKSLLTLANSGDDIKRLNKELANTEDGAQGAAAAMAELKLDNLSGDVTKLGSAWEGFILGIEDGSGALNDLGRGAIQFLTGTITFLGKAIDVLGFAFKDAWHNMKTQASAGADIVVGGFTKIGAGIKLFANKALLILSEVPLIGKAIDKEAVEANIKDAENALIKGSQRIAEGQKKLDDLAIRKATASQRFAASQRASALAVSAKQEAKAQAQVEEEKAKASKEASDKAQKAKEKRDKAIADFKKKLDKKIEDDDAVTKAEKIALSRERHLKELEQLGLDIAEKRELTKQVNSIYDKQEAELKLEKEIFDKELLLEAEATELQRILSNDRLTSEERIKLQVEYLEKKRQLDVEAANGNADEIDKINKKAKAAKAKITKAEQIAKGKADKAELDSNVNTALESFGIAQEVAVAKMIMNAPEGIGNSCATAAKNYAPPISLAMGALGAAGVVVPIIKGLSDIKSTRFSAKGKTSKGASGGSASTAAMTAGPTGVGSANVSDLAANNASRLGTNTSLSSGASFDASNSSAANGAQGQVVFSEASYADFQNQVQFREDKSTV